MKIKISALDRKFSLYIRGRAKWTCERCHKKYSPPTMALHCSHFWGRARKSVRFDPENAASICHGCHVFLTSYPEEHRAWFLKRLGQNRYDALMLRANNPVKVDYTLVGMFLDNVVTQVGG